MDVNAVDTVPMDLSPIAAAMVASAPVASKSLHMGEPQPPVPEQIAAEPSSSSLPTEEVKEVKDAAKDGKTAGAQQAQVSVLDQPEVRSKTFICPLFWVLKRFRSPTNFVPQRPSGRDHSLATAGMEKGAGSAGEGKGTGQGKRKT